MLACLLLLCAVLLAQGPDCLAATIPRQPKLLKRPANPGGVPNGNRPIAQVTYQSKCNDALCDAIAGVHERAELLHAQLDTGAPIEDLGVIADDIMSEAADRFSSLAATPPGGEALYNKKMEELHRTAAAPLQAVFSRQLAALRRQALVGFPSGEEDKDGSVLSADRIAQAVEAFRAAAESSRCSSGAWGYKHELAALREELGQRAALEGQAMRSRLQAQRETAQAMDFVQQQQQQLMSMQQQLQRAAAAPWNGGLTYRVPNSNFQMTGTYQQGRANVQLTCVPEEAAGLLGANGFVQGVLPGDVGLSCNINI